MPETNAAVMSPPAPPIAVHRIEVHARPDSGDPRAAAILRAAQALSAEERPTNLTRAAVYLIEGALSDTHIERLATDLLADHLAERSVIGAASSTGVHLEVHPLPGVTDPAAASVQQAVAAMIGVEVVVRTGVRFDIEGLDGAAAMAFAQRALANPVIHDIHSGTFHPTAFPSGYDRTLDVLEMPLATLSDSELEALSRDAHLFLSLEEMQAIQTHYRTLGRDPREIELETLAQTWSEHCVHKTLKATIDYSELPGGDGPSLLDTAHARPHHDVIAEGSMRINNLLKGTIAAATHQLMAEDLGEWCLSVFVDNAGIVGFDEDTAVCIKVETHNHPSAIEPYGGAATGIGGCIRDIMGTGLAAKPIAAMDVFCVGLPDQTDVPQGCLHPRRVLNEVVGGVRDYGNRMGIPTLDGAVWFDENYVGNPLVYVGCIGVMPRWAIAGDAQPGDRIIAMGGRTGRDGIHGATFSSAELTDTHADEFSHAVQIGNPITEKTMLDAILAVRDHESGCLYSAITDCGAGGFSSAVGEMGEQIGADVELRNAPLKYAGLTPTEIWISEAQERMVMAVPAGNVEHLAEICKAHGVEWCDLGVFGTPDRELILHFDGVEVGRLSMEFMHDGVPMSVRTAVWDPAYAASQAGQTSPDTPPSSTALTDFRATTLALLAHPNIASKAWIIRQYDHEVQGGSVIKPFAGPKAGPMDAAVIRPNLSSTKALAIGNGLATGLARDPYVMGLAAIDECVRNLVCVGADPSRIAILDNFCWPSCGDERTLGSLVRAAEACLDGGLAYRTPFVSGKDSLSNQFQTDDGRTIRVPPTLLISGIGIVPDETLARSMDLKRAGNSLLLVGATTSPLGGSHLVRLGLAEDGPLPQVDLECGPANARAVHQLILAGLVESAHDLSEGGVLVAAAEMAFAGDVGLRVDLATLPTDGEVDLVAAAFAETPSRYMLEVKPSDLEAITTLLGPVAWACIGTLTNGTTVEVMNGDDAIASMELSDLHAAWSEAIDS